MRLSMSQVTTFRWSFEEDLRRFAAAGYQGIGIWRQKMSDVGDEIGIDLLSESGLSVSSLTWAGGFTGGDLCSHQESIEDGIDAIRLAAAVRAECLVVYTGSRGGHTRNHARRLARTALDELIPVAEDLDVILAIEPMHRECATNWTFLTELRETMEFLDQLDSGSMQLVFDTYHFGNVDLESDLFASLVPRLALVQLGDARHDPSSEQDRCVLGEGVLPLGEIITRLQDSGYDGFYEVELLGEEIEQCGYCQLLESSQAAIAEMACF